MGSFRTERKINKYSRPEIESPLVHYRRILNRPLLTERDKQIVLFIYYSRCVTISQIAEVFFRYREDGRQNQAYMTVCRRRLRILYINHIIDRFFVDVGAFNGTSEQHVVLDEVGALIVAGSLGVNVSDLKWRKEQNEVRLPYLQHTIEINQLATYIRQHARKKEDRLEVWKVENHNYHTIGDQKLCPDAYFQYFRGNIGFHGFWEHHRGTMTPYQFRTEKVPKYREFYQTGEYEKHYKTYPYVFVSCYDWDTANDLKKAVEQEGAGGVVWHFSTFDLIEAGWFDSIWLVNDSDRLHSIEEYLQV